MVSKIWDGVRGEYLGPSAIRQDQAAARKAWEKNKPVPSRVYTRVGRLVIEPELLQRAVTELKERDQEIVLGLYNDSLGNPMEVEGDSGQPSAFLMQFLNACGWRFTQVVRLDLRTIAPGIEFTSAQRLNAGPYQFDSYNNPWHRDSDALGGLTYTVTAAGSPTTLFATGSYRNSQFGGVSNEIFEGTDPPPGHIHAAKQCDIMVHDQALTLHRAPPRDHNGETRIFSQILVKQVLDYPPLAPVIPLRQPD